MQDERPGLVGGDAQIGLLHEVIDVLGAKALSKQSPKPVGVVPIEVR